MVATTSRKDRQAIGSAAWVGDQLVRLLRNEGTWGRVRDVYPDRVYIEMEEGTLLEFPYEVMGSEVIFGEPREAGVSYVLKSMPKLALTGVIVDKQDSRRVVLGPVLVPDEPDSDGDVVSKEQIERVAHLWMEKFQNIDYQHTLNNVARPVESYIASTDLVFPGGTIPEGSWVLATKVPDEMWEFVVKGELTGFSLMAVSKDDLAATVKNDGDITAAWKRTTLADLGEDWIVPFVSIVDTPAVPKAKWVAVKRHSDKPSDPDSPNRKLLTPIDHRSDDSLMDKLRVLLGGESQSTRHSDKAGRRFSNATVTQLKTAVEALSALLDEAEKERESTSKGNSEVDEAQVQKMLDAAIAPLAESITTIAEAVGKMSEGEELELIEGTVEVSIEDTEAFKELTAKIDALTEKSEEDAEFRAELEKRLKAVPKGLIGQDDSADNSSKEEDDDTYTDAFGVRYRRDGAGRAHRLAS